MQELLWLLLPVAAASGWIAARRSNRRSVPQERAPLKADYFRGLNFLLNEQPDKAIEVFIKMLEVDSDTVETHLALGNLFRRRGETDRAIRIHQNLIARPTLSRTQRGEALLELGQDYMRAGWLDRAESLFQELLENKMHMQAALRQLLDIYQQEKDWEQAIATARRLETENGTTMRHVIAQFYCEMAVEARANGNVAEAGQWIKKALSHDRNCVRASILQGELAQGAGQIKQALRAYQRIENQDIDYLPEVLPRIGECYREQGSKVALMEYLLQILDRYEGVTPTIMLADIMLEREGPEAATEFVQAQLRKRPSVRGLARLIDLNLTDADAKAQDDLSILKDLVTQLLTGCAVYKCRQCGFEGKTLHWQCPSCKDWNTVKPIHGVGAE